MLTHPGPKISSDFIYLCDKIAGGRGAAPDPAGGAHDSRRSPRLKSNPTIHAFSARPEVRCPH